MKYLLGAVFLLACLCAGCSSNLGCEVTMTCVPPCEDVGFAKANPALCSRDAETADTATDVGHADNAMEASVEDDGSHDDGRDDSSVDSRDGSEARADSGEGGVADAVGVEETFPIRDAGTGSTEAEAAVICDPTSLPSVAPCVVDEQFGVFVSPVGNDAAVGTRAAPLRTIGAALDRAHTAAKRVYACDNGTGYAENITISAALDGSALFGGFSCTDWSYSTTRRALVRSPSGSALVVRGITTGVLFENIEFDSPNATEPGASSIGAIVDTAQGVVLRRVRISGGSGAAGSDGVDGDPGTDGAMAGGPQRGLAAMCSASSSGQLGGSWPAEGACGSVGGNGAAASRSSASPGFAGTPQTGVTPAGVNNRGLENMPGQPGSLGNLGMPGILPAATGTFSSMGYLPPPVAGSGMPGLVGQGGGGGGSSEVPATLGNCLGASGGAGGMGGCGGQPGTGGGGGGASVALLVWASRVSLDTCDLVAGTGGTGGHGGNGGHGGSGQAGAMGGSGLATDAGTGIGGGGQGGRGGNGGAGGPGAGGSGGPSYALVFSGSPPTRTATVFLAGRGGAGGPGGASPAMGVDGGLLLAPAGMAGLSGMEFIVQ